MARMSGVGFAFLVLFGAFWHVANGEITNAFTFPIRSRQKFAVILPEDENDQGIHTVSSQSYSSSVSAKYGVNKIGLLGNTVEYFAEILVGTNPPQLFSLQVDTGSAITAIPDSRCSTCYHHNPLYNSNSPTSRIIPCRDPKCTSGTCNKDGSCKFSVSYADSSGIEGKLVEDVISLPTISSIPTVASNAAETLKAIYDYTPFVFAVMDSQYPENSFQYHGVDGIMGMAYDSSLSCVPNCITPIMDVFVKKYNIPDVFSMSLQLIENNTQYNVPGGSMTIGGHDPNVLGNSSFHYLPITAQKYYTVDVGDVKVGGESIGMEGITKAIVDSGSSFIAFPPSSYSKLVDSFQKNFCDLPFVCGETSIFENKRCINATLMTDEVFDRFPTIEFYFDGIKTKIPPRQYFQKQQTTDMKDIYCLGIVEGSAQNIALGNSFMQGFYITFDRQNARVGFANDNLIETAPHIVKSTPLPVALIAGCASAFVVMVVIVAIVVAVVVKRRNVRRIKEAQSESQIHVEVGQS
eukprot:TRINITY_DN3720_c0_g1_i2.p1 TRINITY_DN3720_c0_g1~~TRINITY_DN3720_c0_g1_i2.p1  ORF type:complete len:521 (-),score=158.01 TRINITY_DN3720_c0_g1_i2:98-1660(-)